MATLAPFDPNLDLQDVAACFEFCKKNNLGCVSADDFDAHRDTFDWRDEARRFKVDEFKREQALISIKNGKNVLITGAGGVGKSHMMPDIEKTLSDAKRIYAKVASTGAAAFRFTNGGGTTLHAWTGLQTFKEPAEVVIKRYRTTKDKRKIPVVEAWRKTDALIIDEVSMLLPSYFKKLDMFGRAIRGCFTKAFGGIQLIMIGDFTQLEPVVDKSTKSEIDAKLLIDMENWTDYVDEIVLLTYSHRQKTDGAFCRTLNRIRLGVQNDDDVALLRTRIITDLTKHPDATLLFPTNSKVDDINQRALDAIDEPGKHFKLLINLEGFNNDKFEEDNAIALATKACPVPEDLVLKRGCRVMLVKNLDVPRGLVNGATGVVDGFDSMSGMPIVKFDKGPRLTINKVHWDLVDNVRHRKTRVGGVPLKLAYAMTIHKAQGMTLKKAIISLSGLFADGQGYVALSRVEEIQNLFIYGDIDFKRLKPNNAAIRFYENLRKSDPYYIPFGDADNDDWPDEDAVALRFREYTKEMNAKRRAHVAPHLIELQVNGPSDSAPPRGQPARKVDVDLSVDDNEGAAKKPCLAGGDDDEFIIQNSQ